MRRLMVALGGIFLVALSGCRQSPQSNAPVTTLKILVDRAGLYRITARDLSAAGFSWASFDNENVHLAEDGRSIPFVVDQDGLIFYGRLSESRYTPYRTYILRGGEPGLQMDRRDASPVPGKPRRQTVRRTHTLERNLEYVSDASVDGKSQGSGPWFWQTIGLEPTEPITFQLPDVAGGTGQLRVRFVGISLHRTIDPDHNVQLALNDLQPITFSWDGQQPHEGIYHLPHGALASGSNSIRFLSAPQDHLDISKLDWIEIDYDSLPRASQNYLAFSSDSGVVKLEAFSTPPIVVDVTNPERPVLLEAAQNEGSTSTIHLAQPGEFIAAASDGFLRPADIKQLQTASWNDSQQQADLLIITTTELSAALNHLVAARAEQGLTSVVVPVTEIYDIFGHGTASPESINRFLRFAVENWRQPAPRYVLIVGDATLDYWGFLASRSPDPVEPPANQVPPYLVPVNFGGETVSDARLADIDGDYLPDLAIGRWPVNNADDVRRLVEHTLQYETSEVARDAIFAVDDSSAEFTQLAESVLAASAFPRERSQLLVGPGPDALAKTWRDGAWLVTYAGHGSLQLWSQDEMLSSASLASVLAPGVQPVIVQLTCLTGLFAHPEITSLSEAMLKDKNGPALVVGATSLTLSTHQEPFAIALLEALQDPSVVRMGDALQLAQGALDIDNIGLREISDTFTLLGDPSARIVRPQ